MKTEFEKKKPEMNWRDKGLKLKATIEIEYELNPKVLDTDYKSKTLSNILTEEKKVFKEELERITMSMGKYKINIERITAA